MSSLQPGTSLKGGKYVIDQVLGQGGFGITYLAHDTHGRAFAIKEFFMRQVNQRETTGAVSDRTANKDSAYYRNRFLKEAASLKDLNHPGIVKYVETFDENNTSYYVMEHVAGDNLDTFASINVIPIEDAVEMVKETAGILKYMHSRNKLHLDLKPANIMRRRSDGRIVLIDFGLSKTFTSTGHAETSVSMNAQTEGYAPLEMAYSASSGDLMPTIDVYALGATLYKLLTRLTPPVANDVLNRHDEFMANMRRCNVPESLIRFIDHAMAPVKGNRIQDMTQFISELDAAMSTFSEATQVQTPPPLATPIQPQPDQAAIAYAEPQAQPSTPPLDNQDKPQKSKWKKGCQGCLVALGILVALFVIIGVNSDPNTENTTGDNSQGTSATEAVQTNNANVFKAYSADFGQTFYVANYQANQWQYVNVPLGPCEIYYPNNTLFFKGERKDTYKWTGKWYDLNGNLMVEGNESDWARYKQELYNKYQQQMQQYYQQQLQQYGQQQPAGY